MLMVGREGPRGWRDAIVFRRYTNYWICYIGGRWDGKSNLSRGGVAMKAPRRERTTLFDYGVLGEAWL